VASHGPARDSDLAGGRWQASADSDGALYSLTGRMPRARSRRLLGSCRRRASLSAVLDNRVLTRNAASVTRLREPGRRAWPGFAGLSVTVHRDWQPSQ
jgi:hypothetical protein